jgi:hypothetical protein
MLFIEKKGDEEGYYDIGRKVSKWSLSQGAVLFSAFGNAQLLHLPIKGGGFHAEQFCRSTGAFDPPSSRF